VKRKLTACHRIVARCVAAKWDAVEWRSNATDFDCFNQMTCAGGAARMRALTREKTRRRSTGPPQAGGFPVVTGYIAARKGLFRHARPRWIGFFRHFWRRRLDARNLIILWTRRRTAVLTAVRGCPPTRVTLDEVSSTTRRESGVLRREVLHPMTLRQLSNAAIPVWIRNSFEPHKAEPTSRRRPPPERRTA